jgi:hypothetical protein
MKFLALTRRLPEAIRMVYIPIEKITAIAEEPNGKTVVYVESATYFMVKETSEQILKMIENPEG